MAQRTSRDLPVLGPAFTMADRVVRTRAPEAPEVRRRNARTRFLSDDCRAAGDRLSRGACRAGAYGTTSFSRTTPRAGRTLPSGTAFSSKIWCRERPRSARRRNAEVEGAGYPIVLHVHDEIVCECAKGAGDVENSSRIVTRLPAWAAGLPFVAKATRRNRYAEGSTKTAAPIDDRHQPTRAPRITHQRPPQPVAPVPPATPETQNAAAARFSESSSIETLDERLAQNPLPDLVGDSGLVHCPFHDDDTPSCHIYEDHFYCFGCGAVGNHLDWLRDAEGMSDDAAFDAICNWQGPAAPRREAGAERKLALALQLWAQAGPIFGTAAIDYLGKVRGIDVTQLPTDGEALRFHPNCPFGRGRFEPCLLALFRDVATDEPVGIHRVMLDARRVRRQEGAAAHARRAVEPERDQDVAGDRSLVRRRRHRDGARGGNAADASRRADAAGLGGRLDRPAQQVRGGARRRAAGDPGRPRPRRCRRRCGRRLSTALARRRPRGVAVDAGAAGDRLQRSRASEIASTGMTEKPPIDWSSGWIELDEPTDTANKGKVNGKAGATRRPFPFIDTSRWRSEEPPAREWTVPDRIPRRQVALFSGEGAAGKSTILLHECAAHALDREWLNTMPTPGPAFFIDAEDGEDEIWRRLADVARHYDVSVARDPRSRIPRLLAIRQRRVAGDREQGRHDDADAEIFRAARGRRRIKPIMIGIASSACVFAGEENNRSQVQQFVGLLTKIAIFANGAVQLVSHPSLAGVTSDTGLSGSTQWHNAVRARAYLKGVKAEDGELIDNDLREIVFKKNQYGRISESIVLRYQGGLYLPVAGESLGKAERAQAAQDAFLALLKRYRNENRNVSTNVSKTYAPALFAREDEAKAAGVSKTDLETAMRELFRTGKIWNEPFDKPSRERYRLAIK